MSGMLWRRQQASHFTMQLCWVDSKCPWRVPSDMGWKATPILSLKNNQDSIEHIYDQMLDLQVENSLYNSQKEEMRKLRIVSWIVLWLPSRDCVLNSNIPHLISCNRVSAFCSHSRHHQKKRHLSDYFTLCFFSGCFSISHQNNNGYGPATFRDQIDRY